MILGIGVDLVSVDRFVEKLKNEAFRQKVFSAVEIADCEASANAGQRFAGKFAAKEALMKAIGHGIRQAVGFSQIEVRNMESGAPTMVTSGKAAELIAALGVEQVHLSISHTAGMAVAMVVLEGG